MKKTTQKQKNGSVILTIILLLVYVFIQVILFYYFKSASISLIGLIILNIFFAIYCIYVLSGVGKANREVRKENKYLKKINPYIYYRELPNPYGIGVTTLLMDSKIENYKDIVAVILDLCAKKYLNLEKQNDKYIIKILKGIDDSLFSNEKYILNLIVNNNIKNINYREWYNYCMQDGINLGLFINQTKKNKYSLPSEVSEFNPNRIFKSKYKLGIILVCLYIIMILMSDLSIFYIIFSSIIGSIFVFFGTIFLTMFIEYINLIIKIFSNIIKKMKYYKYKNYIDKLNNNLKKTGKGVDEFHKLCAFKAFIRDFGSFVDKHPEEVILWDRYLSYAQVFGLTKEIMASGYNDLIENSSFKIDNIDNINFDNIEIQ